MKTNALDIYNDLPSQLNLAQHLLQINLDTGNKDKIAFFCQNEKYSYDDLNTHVRQFADLLQSLDIRPEERVAILLPDCMELIITFLGSIWYGAIPVLISEDSTDHDIQYMFNDCRTDIIVTNALIKEKFYHQFPNCKWIVVDENNTLIDQLNTYKTHTAAFRTSKNEAAFWVYTSGSTGMPKAVIHAHHSPIIASELYGKNTLKLTCDDIIYSTSKMSFSYGLGATLYMPMYVGASSIISANKNPFQVIEIIGKNNPTVLFSIPHIYANILSLQSICPMPINSLRLCISAAEQLPPSLWKKWRDIYGMAICEGIGTTESTHIFISNTPNNCIPGCSGKPVPGYHVDIVDENGNAVQAGEVGLLKVTGEGFMLGYWNRLQESRHLLRGNTLHTGDCYYKDEYDNFYFLGRKDDLIKINGRWIVPTEIENIILQMNGIKEVAVIIHNGYVEQTKSLVAYITLQPELAFTNDFHSELKRHIKQHLPKYKIPKSIIAVESLPRTTTGKIYRRQLIERKNEDIYEI